MQRIKTDRRDIAGQSFRVCVLTTPACQDLREMTRPVAMICPIVEEGNTAERCLAAPALGPMAETGGGPGGSNRINHLRRRMRPGRARYRGDLLLR
jgi:hypothetical protein